MASQSLTFPTATFSFVGKHRYFLGSLAIHLLILVALSHMTIKTAPTSSAAKQVRISMQNAYKINMQASVKNISNLEQALISTLDDATKRNLDLEPLEDIQEVVSKSSPSQLFELARKISENIRKIERELRAKDLERAVAISHFDALKTVMSLELPIPQYNANKMPGAQMVRSVERFEENAKNSLRNRLEDMNARGIGEPLSPQKPEYTDSGGLNVGKNNVKDAINLNNSLLAIESIHSKNDYVDVWLDHVPPVNKPNPKRVAGRIIKDGAQYADRIFIDSWYIIGPFSLSAVKSPPEYGIDLNGVYYGKDNQTLRWQYLGRSSYPLTPPQIDKTGVFFGYTEVMVDREQDLWVWVGADDFTTLSLNNKIIWQSDVFNKKFNKLVNDKNSGDRDNWNMTEYKRLVRFKAGKNSIMFKLTNSDAAAFFSLVLTK